VDATKTYGKTKFEVCIMAYTEGHAEIYAEAYTRAHAKTKSKIYARTYAKAYINTIIEAKAKAYTKAYSAAFSTAFSTAYDKAYPEAIAKAQARAEEMTKVNPQAEAEAKVEAKAKAKRMTKAQLKVVAEAKRKAKVEVEAKAKAKAKSEAYAEAKAMAEPVAKAEAEARAEAEPKAEVEAEAKAEATANVEALASLYNLAIDCLRLSTYFFHPIHQCAQHVYHTAMPLSPTSTQLHESCIQSVIDNQLSQVTAFSGAPNTWGSLLRAIDTRPRQVTCITTSIQNIIVACEDIVNIYDAVTFALRQSLHTPEMVIKIQDLPDGSILFFAHSFSVTMWDMQTGGLIHTFTVQSKINDIAVSATHIACGSSDGSITFWNSETKEETKGFGNGQPVIGIYWLPPLKLAVVTQNSIHIQDFTLGTLESLSIPGHVWGAVYLVDRSEFLVGILWPGTEADQDQCNFRSIKYENGCLSRWELPMPMAVGQLMLPTLVNKEVVCITLPSGVQSFSTESYSWTSNPPLLDAARSVAVSLNRNLVVQTKDSIKIFPVDILTSGKARKDTHLGHIYPLGKSYVICVLQPTRCLSLLELETLQELCPDDNNSPSLESLVANQLASASWVSCRVWCLRGCGGMAIGYPTS